MSGIIYKAGAGAIVQQIRLDAYANNLANVSTVGFKSDYPVFRQEQNETLSTTHHHSTPQLSPYAPAMEQVTDFSSGTLQNTGNSLDLALTGQGFFEVQTDEGVRYTRNGQFSINEDGLLSNSDGWPVMGQGGEIRISGSSIEISENGEVSVDGDIVGVIRVVDFPEPYDLLKTGGSLFEVGESGAQAQDAANYSVTQGAVESSNVNAIRTMTEMIDLLRVFETYQKVIRAADDTTAKTVSEVGKPT